MSLFFSPDRHWFSQSPHPNTPFKSSSFITGVLMGGNEGGGRGGERWSLFGARPIVQKSPTDPGSETNTPGKNLLYGDIILAFKCLIITSDLFVYPLCNICSVMIFIYSVVKLTILLPIFFVKVFMSKFITIHSV